MITGINRNDHNKFIYLWFIFVKYKLTCLVFTGKSITDDSQRAS